MLKRKFETPLVVAFFYSLVFVACTPKEQGQSSATFSCISDSTPIAEVQGNGRQSPLVGHKIVVQGIVTHVQVNRGIYIESAGPDQDKLSSNAVYVQSQSLSASARPGQLISVLGEVSELGEGSNTLTSITDIAGFETCSSAQPLPRSSVSLPLDNIQREALEAMRIELDDPLTVTDVYRLSNGRFTLAGNGIQFVPTEISEPGPQTKAMSQNNRDHALPASLPDNSNHNALLVSGAVIERALGVLVHDGRGLRIALHEVPQTTVQDFPEPQSATPNSLRVVGMNLHNYFNGDGNQGGFPTARGAETHAEFLLQRQRIGAAIKALQPHILAVMELENDGFGETSAAQDFISLANDATGFNWQAGRPQGDNTGNDEITVGLYYSKQHVQPVGPAQTLAGETFRRSRQPMAQLYQVLPDGENILVVVNHFKSKGSCPDSGTNANQNDGQGCWNPVRVATAEELTAWVNGLAENAGTANVLILGDMNAYRNENPIMTIREAGFTELMDERQGQTYSYIYFGQAGTLDYAFSSAALAAKVQRAYIWHVNAGFPVNMELPRPWLGFSDHDPVVTDLRLIQSATSD